MDNSTTNQNGVDGTVVKGLYLSIKARIDTLLLERGVKWADVYHQVGWNKSFASLVRNGKIIPKSWQRVALAKALKVDTSVLWEFPQIQSDKIISNSDNGEEKA